MLYQWSFSHLKLSFVEIDVPISSQFLIYIKASIDVRKLIDQFLANTQQTRKEKKQILCWLPPPPPPPKNNFIKKKTINNFFINFFILF